MPIDPTTTNLEGKDYSNRDMRGNSLARYRLMRCNFRGADLRGVSFREADCTGADFTGAKLEGTDFTDAIMEGTIYELTEQDKAFNLVLPPPEPQIDSGSPVVWQLEDNSKALEEENAQLQQRIQMGNHENHLLRQELDSLKAYAHDLEQQLAGAQDKPMNSAPARRRRGKQ